MTCDAIVAGHICLDIFPDLSASTWEKWEAAFRPGHLLEAGPAILSTGGAVSNTGLALHKLGVATRLMGKIGSDLIGRAIREIVNAHAGNLADDMIVDEAAHSSYTIIVNLPGVDRIFIHYPGANDSFGADDIRYDLMAGARLFHFGYPPVMRRMFERDGAELVEMLRRVKEMGLTTSLDMTLPDPTSPAGRADWRTILRNAMPHVDIFLPSIEETLYMLQPDTCRDLDAPATPALLTELSSQLLEMGGRIVGFKLGERGLYLRTAGQAAIESLGAARPSDPAAWADKELWAPCFRVNVVGTTGAGDATIAGFLAALLRDMSPEEAVTAAVAVGACNVEAADALGGIRSWDETWQRIERGWARHPMTLDAAGWHFNDERHLWAGPKSTLAAYRENSRGGKNEQVLDRLGFTTTQHVKGRASIADLFSPDQRCGVYVLHFSTGEFYAGQATDVTRRYIQHRNIHQDIEKISFKATSPDRLNEEERSVIWRLEQWGWPLRNVVFTSFPKGKSDFDLIMPPEEQERWIENPGFVDDKGERLVDPDLRRKFHKAYERFIRTPYAEDIIEVVRIYVRVGIPAFRRSEVSFWCLSCGPKQGEVYSRVNTGNRDSPAGWQNREVYARVNVNWQEVLTVFVYKQELWLSLHMARSPLEKAFDVNLDKLLEKYPTADNTGHQYIPGGQDQTSFDIPAATAKAFITDPSIIAAIRLLNLRLMKKGPCAYGRFHCMDLADRVIDME